LAEDAELIDTGMSSILGMVDQALMNVKMKNAVVALIKPNSLVASKAK
jgi:hypothetical protein